MPGHGVQAVSHTYQIRTEGRAVLTHDVAADTRPKLASLISSPIALLRVGELNHVERRLREGVLVRVSRGVYTDAASWAELKPWDRYTARVHAVALTHPHAVFCYESAVALWGLPVFGDPIVVHLLGDAEATSRLQDGIRTHSARRRQDIVELGGVLVTGKAATVVDMARSRHHVVGLTVADAALRRFVEVGIEDLAIENAQRASTRGRRHARWPLEQASAAAETPLESVSRAGIMWLGFRPPRLQVAFPTEFGSVDRVDMWWGKESVVGEADGDLKYDGTLGVKPATAFRKEKERDRRLQRHASGIVHWGWRDAVECWPLRDALLNVGLSQVSPPDSARITGMRALLLGRTE